MKLFLKIVLLCCSSSAFVLPTIQETFLYANNLYQKGDYAQAEKLYESIENKGAAVWYNLGNSLYKLERYAEALASWKRALRHGGSKWYIDIQRNCSHVNEILEIQELESWYTYLTRLVNSYSLLFWQLLLFLTLSAFCLTLLFFSRKKYKIFITLCATLLCLTSGALGVKYWELSKRHALVLDDIFLLAGTDERFSHVGTLKKGEEVLVSERRGEWVKVATNEANGWVLAHTIITI